jgi:SAM-dependent methyltransferase
VTLLLLNDIQDAYGHQLYDCFRGKQIVEVVERDDGFIDFSAALPQYYLAEYKLWRPHEKAAMRYAKGRILDVGCGGGRVSLYFQKKGLDVLGIDVSPLAVKVCKLRGLRKPRVMSVTDVSSRLGMFDSILMIGNNFGLFANPNRAKRLLRAFYHITTPNALIIAESNDPYRTTEPFHLAYHRRNRREGRMSGELTIRVRYKKYKTPWFKYLIVSKKEMKRILEGTGWRVKRFVDSKGSPYIGIIEKISRG